MNRKAVQNNTNMGAKSLCSLQSSHFAPQNKEGYKWHFQIYLDGTKKQRHQPQHVEQVVEHLTNRSRNRQHAEAAVEHPMNRSRNR